MEVTGLRASLEASLAKKRNADSVVEVITADDIGKLPDKNVADALQRVPGVNIASSAGGEGGFSENDRVSIRGTSPSLTQTLVNGHMISSGDWFVLDQEGGSLGRSVSYALMPSEILGSAVVHKSATADLVEGGVAGAVDMITRRPLDFKKLLTVEGTIQAIYSDLPAKTDPQPNALIAWKNDASTFGALVQAFSETRHERRDGQEIFGYGAIDPTWAAAVGDPTSRASPRRPASTPRCSSRRASARAAWSTCSSSRPTTSRWTSTASTRTSRRRTTTAASTTSR